MHDRGHRRRGRLGALALTGALAWSHGCAVDACRRAERSQGWQDAVACASAEARVPASLLTAVAQAESRLAPRVRPGGQRGWVQLGPLRPSRDPRRVATALPAAVAEHALDEPVAGLRAAAALLATAARAHGPLPSTLAAWGPALRTFNGAIGDDGGADPIADAAYADEVLALARGDAGERASPSPSPAIVLLPGNASGHAPPRSTPRVVDSIVIHTTEDTFANSLAYLRRAATATGAHYLVRAHDGLVVQLVAEDDVAFHDACFNGASIGIEHEGFSADGARWYSDAMYRASAALVRDIARRHGIPLDRAHILGHGETPDCSDHVDPGSQWDWPRYMRYVRGEE